MPYRRFSQSPGSLTIARYGLRQRELAAALGTTRQTISAMLGGRAHPHPDLIPTVARLAGPEAAHRLAVVLARIEAAAACAFDEALDA